MNISVIIPNYNGAFLLEKNLRRVINSVLYYLNKHNDRIEIIIVDDGSTDNSLKYIKDYTAGVKYKNLEFKILENKKNLGFSKTVNRGAKEAKGNILVLLNSDVVPDKDFLEPLLSHFKDEKMFAVGCMDKSVENGKIVLRGRGVGHFERGMLVHKKGEINRNETLWVSGGSGAFRKSIWEKLGGLNELYAPFYWEDIDLSYRALKSGYKVLFEPKSIVIHEHEKGAIKSTYSGFRVKTISYRNQFIFIWSNITDLDLKLDHIFWLPYYFIKALIGLDIAFFIGFTMAIALIFKIEESASPHRKLFVKTDRQTIDI